MEWFVLVTFTIFILVIPVATAAYLRNWRFFNREAIRVVGLIFYGRESWRRAHVRTGAVTLSFFGYPFCLLGIAFVMLEKSVWSGTALAKDLFLVAILAGLALSIVLYWSIMLWNKPKWLVPPDLRDEPGLLETNGRGRGPAHSGKEAS
jgi:hypothetical protein